jgi:multisubunit Na+/H+ antiporter MnhB subunit
MSNYYSALTIIAMIATSIALFGLVVAIEPLPKGWRPLIRVVLWLALAFALWGTVYSFGHLAGVAR